MPAAGGNRGYAKTVLPKAPPRNPSIAQQHPAPPSGGLLSGVAHAIGNVGTSTQQAATSATTQHTSGRPGGDVQSGGYSNFAQADQFKNTPAYKNAILAVFRAQSAPQKAAILAGAAKNSTTEGNLILDHVRSVLHSDPFSSELKGLIHPTSGGGFLDNVLAASEKALTHVAGQAAGGTGPEIHTPNGTVSQLGPGALLSTPIRAGIDVGRATLQDPGVLPKTAKGLADTVAGSVAGAVQLPINIVQQGPVKAIGNLASQAAQDYSRRYGPLVQGNDQAFINRIKKEGAGPEVFDAAALVGGADATAGRAVADLARTKKALTGKENFLTRPRPQLMTSGGHVRPQQLASTAGRAAAQRLEDKLRQARTVHRPGELRPTAPHTVAPLFQSHAIRVVHSGVAHQWRRALQENLKREVRGRPGSALHAVGKLNSAQKEAVYHAVHGIRMDTPAHLREDLTARALQISGERLEPASLGNRIPAQHAAKVDELQLINRVMANADKIAGPKMVAFQRGEAARAGRIEAATNLHPATAQARRYRPQGELLGVQHPDVRTAHEVAALQSQADHLGRIVDNPPSVDGLHQARRQLASVNTRIDELRSGATRQQQLAAYVNDVKAKADKAGLPEPGYFRHQPIPDTKFGDFTSGAGHRAMPADKMSTWELHRAGVADHSVQAYVQGLARSVKRPLQWRLTDEQFRHAALPEPTREEIQAALGHDKAVRLLTGHELRQVLAHRGDDLSKVAFYNPGRLAESTLADHGLLPKGKIVSENADETSAELHHQLGQEGNVQLPGERTSERFLTTQGWKAVPKTAFDEIHAGLKGGSLGGRLVGKVQGTSAGLILGQNPHFLVMNTLAHAIPAIAGTKGAILADAAKVPLWWHGLSDAERDRVRMFEGGRGGHYNTTARLGSQAPNKIAAFGRRLDENGLVQRAKGVNPLHAILRAEDLQSNFFRHAVMMHEAKRMAFQEMGHEYGRAVAAWEQVKHIFTLKPPDRMRAILNDMTKLEELGRTTVNILGDYGRFTARERAFLNNRAVMFYSFLRHVTRTLLYVLPVRHPLALGLMGELGNLHVQEVKKLMGGQDMPWAYGRLFIDKKGKLSSVDLTSTSPVSSPLVDVLSGGVKQLPRLLSPALAPMLDVAYGQTPEGAPVKRNVLSYANDVFSLSYPYRQAAAMRFGLKAQQSDSIPFLHEDPQVYKTKASKEYAAAKQKARGPLNQYLLGSALGVVPKPDDTRVIAQHRAKLAASKGHKRVKHPRIPGAGGLDGSLSGGGLSGGGLNGGF